MTEKALPPVRVKPLGERAWAAVVAAFGFVAGLAPHVLHHAGPLAGAALLAGLGGQLLFFVLGLALSAPMLVRLHRRFRTLVAPALAVAAFAAVFSFSALVIAPQLTDGGDAKPAGPGLQQPAQPSGHARHHGGEGR